MGGMQSEQKRRQSGHQAIAGESLDEEKDGYRGSGMNEQIHQMPTRLPQPEQLEIECQIYSEERAIIWQRNIFGQRSSLKTPNVAGERAQNVAP